MSLEGLTALREEWDGGRMGLRKMRSCLWMGVLRDYAEGLVEPVETGIPPWCLVVRGIVGSNTALETVVETPRGLEWMAAERLDALGVPHEPGLGGRVVVRHPIHQVDLLYHSGSLTREFVTWCLSFLSSQGLSAKRAARVGALSAQKALHRYRELRERSVEARRVLSVLSARNQRIPRMRSYPPPERLIEQCVTKTTD